MEDTTNTGVENTTTEKTFTQEEVNELLQKEGDRRVTNALKKQQEKFDKEKIEAEKLRDMDESQKKEYELDKRAKEISSKEKEIVLIQNKLEASKILAEHGLPLSFIDYVVSDTAEDTMNNITLFEKNWKTAISAEVQQRLAKPSPKAKTASDEGGVSKEAFKKMSIAQQSELYRTNPELYKTLTTH